MAREAVLAEGDRIDVTVSVGAAIADADTCDVEALLAAADRALYAAKRSGRNRVCLATADAGADVEAEAESDALRIAQAMATLAASAEGIGSQPLADVSLLAARVARRLGAPPAQVLRSRLAGLLHDVGKVCLPSPLNRVGVHAEPEGGLIREHPVHGEALLNAVPDLRPVARIVRHHHERWDGAGYPDGLAGDAIALEACIVAAADAWCEMTRDRPDGTPLPEPAALDELDRVAGSRLDPAVVAALRSVLARPRENESADGT